MFDLQRRRAQQEPAPRVPAPGSIAYPLLSMMNGGLAPGSGSEPEPEPEDEAQAPEAEPDLPPTAEQLWWVTGLCTAATLSLGGLCRWLPGSWGLPVYAVATLGALVLLGPVGARRMARLGVLAATGAVWWDAAWLGLATFVQLNPLLAAGLALGGLAAVAVGAVILVRSKTEGGDAHAYFRY